MDKRLGALESLEKKVDNFDRELKKLWVVIGDSNKKSDERLTSVEDKAETADFNLGLANDKIVTLEKQRDKLKEDVVYLQSQSMRDNLIFSNITEGTGESVETTEVILRNFLHEKMKVAKDVVDKIGFERVHRMGAKEEGKQRAIVAKFSLYKEREFVRKQWKSLQGTPYYVNEQFPREVAEKRKMLLPKMKAARNRGDTSWIAYDTLYVNGKPVKD